MSETTPKPQRRLPWARLSVVTCAILILVPCLCVMASNAFLRGQRSGEHSRWRSLGAPPHSGVEIVTGDTDTVYVRTAAGDLYACRHQGRTVIDECWLETQEPFDLHPNTSFDTPLFKDEVELPPGTVVDALDVTTYERDSASEARYALLQDGTVWKWEYDRAGYFDLIVIFFTLIIGAVLSIILVVVLWLGAGLSSFLRRTKP